MANGKKRVHAVPVLGTVSNDELTPFVKLRSISAISEGRITISFQGRIKDYVFRYSLAAEDAMVLADQIDRAFGRHLRTNSQRPRSRGTPKLSPSKRAEMVS